VVKKLTLCLAVNESEILLGLKKRGFGEGRWNGFGGKLEKRETIEEAARREVFEESGLIVKELEKKGIITFEFESDQETLEVHIFQILNFEGEAKESEEMKPRWFNKKEIPFDKMWSDDKYWLPLFLDGKKFKGRFLFDAEKTNEIKDFELIEIEEI